MLNADLPQLLGSSVVWKLKTDCAFKLLILEEREGRSVERKGKKAMGKTAAGAYSLFC